MFHFYCTLLAIGASLISLSQSAAVVSVSHTITSVDSASKTISSVVTVEKTPIGSISQTSSSSSVSVSFNFNQLIPICNFDVGK